LGIAYSVLKKYQQAIDYGAQWLSITRKLGDRVGEGAALDNLGRAYAKLGDMHQAIDFYQQALTIAREIGHRRGEAIASWDLGEALEKQGDLERAAEWMQIGVELLRAVEHPDTVERAAQLELLRQRLAASQSNALGSSQSPPSAGTLDD
jgi:tetratricopeptide (TPR) repeat protein